MHSHPIRGFIESDRKAHTVEGLHEEQAKLHNDLRWQVLSPAKKSGMNASVGGRRGCGINRVVEILRERKISGCLPTCRTSGTMDCLICKTGYLCDIFIMTMPIYRCYISFISNTVIYHHSISNSVTIFLVSSLDVRNSLGGGRSIIENFGYRIDNNNIIVCPIAKIFNIFSIYRVYILYSIHYIDDPIANYRVLEYSLYALLSISFI